MAYIDKEKLKNALPHKTPYDRYGNGFNDCLERVHDAIESVPDADVVEVVRCRDCIHNRDNGGDCDRTIILNEYDSTEYRCAGLEYCSYGERSEE